MTKLEMIRLCKSMQTNSLAQKAALRGLATTIAGDSSLDEPDGAPGLYQEVADAETTVQNHIDALQHIIDRLAQ